MSMKRKISMTEFQKLEKKHPGVDWRKAYDPIPDDEWEKWENFEIPEFLKKNFTGKK